ncbi:hypothetical protein QE416_000931 [Microbacterium sp. SORGH_AS 421]|nr:hypothetical protein [Microbacterium sp. SORGH_AS_0421]
MTRHGDLEFLRRHRQAVGPELGFDRGDEDVGCAQRAADDEAVGGEEVDDRGEDSAGHTAGLAQQAGGESVSVTGQIDHGLDIRDVASGLLRRAGESRSARHGIQAADAPARAGNGRGPGHGDVADVTGRPTPARVEPSSGDDPRTDARPGLDEHLVERLGVATDELADRHAICIVAGEGGHSEDLGEKGGDVDVVPAGHTRRRDEPAGLRRHRPGQRDRGARHRGGAVRLRQRAELFCDAAQNGIRTLRQIQHEVVMGEGGAGVVDEPDRAALDSEIDAGDRAEVAADGETAGSATASRVVGAVFDDDTGRDQRIHACRDGRGGQPRVCGELSARSCGARAQRRQHREGLRAEGRQGDGLRLHPCSLVQTWSICLELSL